MERADLRATPAPETDVVAANLMRPLLLRIAKRMERHPRALIVSGLLVEEADRVAAAFAPQEARQRLTDHGWSALLLESV